MIALFPAAKTPGAMLAIQRDSLPVTQGPGQSQNQGRGWLGMAFHDLLDVVNPLQHLPVVGTVYRAITGDKIGTVEKIAGDTLYGGLWGGVSALADAGFEAVTGKDFGATVLALFTGDDAAPRAVAANVAPTTAQPASQLASAASLPQSADVAALAQSLRTKGVKGDIAARALDAYRRINTPAGAVLATVN